MNVTVERPQPCEAIMTVEVDAKELEQAKDRAYREYAKYVRVPGFRPGKAPRQIIEQMVDADAVLKRAREIAIGPAYKAALAKSELQPYDQGTVNEISEEDDKPLTFKATVPLRPEVTLGNLEGLTATRHRPEVTDETVAAEIQKMLVNEAKLVPSTEPAEDGDAVFADMDTTVAGEAVGATRSATFSVGQNMAEIDNVLRGSKAGDTVETDVEYPAEFADPAFAGKTVHFTLRVNHVLHRSLPELTDEWVAEHTIATDVADLHVVIRRELDKNIEQMAEEDIRSQLLAQIVERAEIHFPTQLVDREVADDLHQLNHRLEERNTTLEQYLDSSRKTLQQLQDEFALAATQRIRNGLVMGKVAQTEDLGLKKEELDAELARVASLNDMKPKELLRRLKDEGQLESLEERMLQDKLFTFLKERAEITDAQEGQ